MAKCNCEENFDCSCQVKDLGTRCIIYDGAYLPNLNVVTNTNLTDILKKLDLIVAELRGTNI